MPVKKKTYKKLIFFSQKIQCARNLHYTPINSHHSLNIFKNTI